MHYITSLALFAVAAQAQIQYPGDKCCTIWQAKSYEGESLTKCHSGTSVTYQLPDYGFHDNVSSWWCGKSVTYLFCRGTSGDCHGMNGTGGAGNVMSAQIGYNDDMDRLFLQPYDAAKSGSVTAFHDADCKGVSGRFPSADNPREIAYYNNSAMIYQSIANDRMSSIMIPYGYSVKLFDSGDFTGTSAVMNGPQWAAGDDTMKMHCQALPSGLNDRVSSLQVYRTEFGAEALGDWVSITATEGIEFTYTLGFKRVTSTETITSQSYNLQLQLTSGIKFEVVSEEETITESFSETLTQDATQSMTEDVTATYSTQCTGEVGEGGGVGLWQWVVKNDNDHTSYTQTKHFLCRYGSLYNVKPACPWNACANGDCSVCKTGWSTSNDAQWLQ